MKALTQRLKQFYRPLEIQEGEPNPLPIVGAALVLFGLFQYAYIIYPLQPGSADWEFLTIKALVDNAFTPILGVALFLAGYTIELPLWRLAGSRILTWFSLVMAVIFVLLMPLAVNDALRLSDGMNTRMATAQNISATQQQKVRKALDNATTMEELEMLTTVLSLTPSLEQRARQMPKDSFVDRREWLWETIKSNQKRMLDETKSLFSSNKTTLRKDTIKCVGGSAFVAAVYFYFFFAFRRVRRKYRLIQDDE